MPNKTAPAPDVQLKKFEGKQVISTSIKVTNAGDGLSAELEVEPVEIQIGDTGYLILEWECVDVNYKPVKAGAKQLDRRHALKTKRAMLTDGDTVAASLDERDRSIQIAADERRVKAAEQLSQQQEAGR